MSNTDYIESQGGSSQGWIWHVSRPRESARRGLTQGDARGDRTEHDEQITPGLSRTSNPAERSLIPVWLWQIILRRFQLHV